VLHRFASPASPFLGFHASKSPRFSASFASGVLQFFAALSKLICTFRPSGRSPFVAMSSGRFVRPPFGVHGVGHNPNSFTLVRGTNVGSGNNSPLRIEPQRGQVSENSSKPPRSEHWRVFHEDVSGSYFANDPGHFHPKSASRAFNSGSLSGGADVLAGKPARNHVNNPAPRLSVK
jgi:hypothetical protein